MLSHKHHRLLRVTFETLNIYFKWEHIIFIFILHARSMSILTKINVKIDKF